MGRKLSSIVRADVIGRLTLRELPREALKHVFVPQTPFDFDCQALARDLVDDGAHAKGPAIVRAILNEVIRPDVARILRTKSDA